MLATIGVDVARDGLDYSTIYVCMDNVVWCEGEYKFKAAVGGVDALTTELLKVGESLISVRGATDLHFRIDTTGGYGAGPADALRGVRGESLRDLLGENHFRVFDVIFNSVKDLQDPTQYYDRITELYARVGEMMANGELAILHPHADLEQDLTGREWIGATRAGQFVKRLEPKQAFKTRFGRSPDHGDGFILAAAPPEAFGITSEIEYIALPRFLTQAVDSAKSWEDSNPYRFICAGVTQYISAADGKLRLFVVIRGTDGAESTDIEVAYIFSDSPWKSLAVLLVQRNVAWCVVASEGPMWAHALDFATRMRDIPTQQGGIHRKTFLARWRGTDARPSWRDKPHKELKLKGEESGYKYVVDVNKAYTLHWSLERWRDGATKTLPWGDLWQVLPCDASGTPEPLLYPSRRSNAQQIDSCLGTIYRMHLQRTGFRRDADVLVEEEPFGEGFAGASALADIGLERLKGNL